MIGRIVSHYKIESLIGAGGMGVVYRAIDTRLNRPVAIKFIKPELTSNPDRVRRFFQEARSAAAVNHHAIAQIYDVGEFEGMTCIVMEYVKGQTVTELIMKQELDLLGSIEIAQQVAEGLGVAHKANIVHRDIKSDNIMVTADGYAKILDFGLAKLLDQPMDTTDLKTPVDFTQTETLMKTIAGAIVGTTAYMSPEQARGRPVSQASDVFSLGIVIYEMVTGDLPFKGNTPIDTMHAIVFDEVQPVTALRKNLPSELQRILNTCLRKNPKARYTDASQLAGDLERLKREIESGVQPSSFRHLGLKGIMDRLKITLPFGIPGVVLAAVVVILALLIIFSRINLAVLISQSIWVIVLGFLVYRHIRNRKARLLKRFVDKVSKFPDVKAVITREDRVTVVIEKAQASIYIHVNSLIEEVNKKRYFGKPVTVAIRDDLTNEEFQRMVREPGVSYIKEDILLEAPQKLSYTKPASKE